MITVFCPDCQTHAVEVEWYEASNEIMVSCANCGERLGTIVGEYKDYIKTTKVKPNEHNL